MKKNDKLTDYFNAAKNNGAEFTQDELQRIVENYSDEKERGLNFTNTKNWKGILFMFTLFTSIISSTILAFLWFNSSQNNPASEFKNRKLPDTYDKVMSTKEIKSIEQIVKEKKSESSQEETETSINHILKTEKKSLNIDAITSITLTKDQLLLLGIAEETHCGISLEKGDIITKFYKFNAKPKQIETKNSSKNTTNIGTAIITPSNLIYTYELMHIQQRVNSTHSDDDEQYSTITVRDINKRHEETKVQPLFITTMKGQILTESLELEGGGKSNDPKKIDMEWLRTHNPNNKQTMLLYVFPDDKHMSEELISHTLADTNYLTVFRRFTPEDVETMKKEQQAQRESINEFVRLNKLIAIKVETDCSDNTLFFWYKPTEEFMNTFPKVFINSSLYKETVRGDTTFWVLTNTTDTLHTEEVPKTGCEFTDICRTSAGAVIESSVFPNPSFENVTFLFELKDQRKCTFSLHNLNGEYVKELAKESTLVKGEHSIVMDIHDIKEGIYLLSMITDKNERVAQRIIISK